jgi:hypothetical protein
MTKFSVKKGDFDIEKLYCCCSNGSEYTCFNFDQGININYDKFITFIFEEIEKSSETIFCIKELFRNYIQETEYAAYSEIDSFIDTIVVQTYKLKDQKDVRINKLINEYIPTLKSQFLIMSENEREIQYPSFISILEESKKEIELKIEEESKETSHLFSRQISIIQSIVFQKK